MIGFVALLVFFQISGEKIPSNEGAYGDGVFYRSVGQTFLENIEQQGYNLVQLTRMLPFALLNLSFSAFHVVKDYEGMRNGMIIWQVVFLALSMYWYFRICKKIRAKTPVMTLGFIFLFFNFTWLKEFWYHPFSPDGLAFALGMGQTNYFLRYEKFKVGMLSVLGAFVSPLLIISGLLMLFLPGDKLLFYPGTRPKSAFPLLLGIFLPLIFATLGWGIWNWGSFSIPVQIGHGLSLVALIPICIWIARRNPIDWEGSFAILKKRVRNDKLSKGMMALAGLVLVLVLLSGNNDELGVFQLLKDWGVATFRFPLDFYQGLVVQWGIGMVLTVLYLRRFVEELGKQGWAAVYILWFFLAIMPFFSALSLASWIPLWMVILVKALKRYHWGQKDMILMGVFALILSLFWLPINSPDLEAWLSGTSEGSFIVQKWAVHSESGRNFWSFLLTVIMSLLVGGVIYFRKSRYRRVMVE